MNSARLQVTLNEDGEFLVSLCAITPGNKLIESTAKCGSYVECFSAHVLRKLWKNLMEVSQEFTPLMLPEFATDSFGYGKRVIESDVPTWWEALISKVCFTYLKWKWSNKKR